MKNNNQLFHALSLILGIVFALQIFSSCAVKPKSDMDSPEYHYKAGMRHVEMGEFQKSISSFERAISLDKKFAPAHAGMGIAYANLKDKKKAKKHVSKAQDLAAKDSDVLALVKVFIDLRVGKRKIKRCRKVLKSIKRQKGHELATYIGRDVSL